MYVHDAQGVIERCASVQLYKPTNCQFSLSVHVDVSATTVVASIMGGVQVYYFRENREKSD